MRLYLSPKFLQDNAELAKTDRLLSQKAIEMVYVALDEPFSGRGNPMQDEKGQWHREIKGRYRFVYTVECNEMRVLGME
jgi:Txe/YoeB family toxin of Txe-Axe toxin-antitoxin module